MNSITIPAITAHLAKLIASLASLISIDCARAQKDDAVSYELRLKGDDILLNKKSPWSIS